MTWQFTLYTRKDCCLCEEMKKVIGDVAARVPLTVQEIDVDGSPDLQEKYGTEVPVLFINGRKACKYRTTVAELKKKLRPEAS